MIFSIWKRPHLFFGLLLSFVVNSGQLHARALPDFVGLVESNSPSVVNISTKQHRVTSNTPRREFRLPDLPENSPFNRFFEDFEKYFGEQADPNRRQPREPRGFEARSLGSGFIISDDGFVLTNYHVVNGADEILVRLSDHREFVGKVIGTDKRSDVALLKIDAMGLPKVNIGSTNSLKVGEWVLAIGSPFGFDHSVTAGIVSAKGRNLPSENYVPFIQTDVAINPGNSGGPLFNLKGEVVGINSQIYSRTGGFMGLSFAIPIEMAMSVVDQLRSSGRVSRGWLGVLIQDVTRDLADSFGLKHPRGALVAKVLPNSPAEEAGIQTGDVILQYNSTQLQSSSMLPPLVGMSRVDKAANLLILRDGTEREIKVNIGELPATDDELIAQGKRGKVLSGSKLGLSVTNISDDLKQSLKLDSHKGVLVEDVRQGPGQDAGIVKGDVIQMLNNKRTNDVSEFDTITSELPKEKTVAVLVMRRTGPRFLTIRVPKQK